MKTAIVHGVLLTASALLPAFGQTQRAQPQLTPEQLQILLQALQTQNQTVPLAAPQAVPAPSMSPEDAEMQELQKERQRLRMQQELENLRRQNQAMKTQVICVPAPPCNWLCREEKRLKAKAEAAAQKQMDKGTEKLGEATHGSVDGRDAPSVSEAIDGATQPQSRACPAGYEPAKPTRSGAASGAK